MRRVQIVVIAVASAVITVVANESVGQTLKAVQDIALDPDQGHKLDMSVSGQYLFAKPESPDSTVPVIYTSTPGTVYVKYLSALVVGWAEYDMLHADIGGRSVVLPPFDLVLAGKEQVSVLSEAGRTVQQLAEAAWTYCEDPVHSIPYADGAPVFDSLQVLSRLTQEHFARAPGTGPGPLGSSTPATFPLSAGYRFTDGQGKGIDTISPPKNVDIMLVDGSDKTLVMPASDGRSVRDLSYDPIGRKVLLSADVSAVVIDVASGERWEHPLAPPGWHVEYTLVRGRPLLLVLWRKLDETHHRYVEELLQVTNLQGQPLHNVSTLVPGAAGTTMIEQMKVSPHLLVLGLRSTQDDVTTGFTLRVLRWVD